MGWASSLTESVVRAGTGAFASSSTFRHGVIGAGLGAGYGMFSNRTSMASGAFWGGLGGLAGSSAWSTGGRMNVAGRIGDIWNGTMKDKTKLMGDVLAKWGGASVSHFGSTLSKAYYGGRNAI